MCVDLHTHSIYSDGTASPAELIDLAQRFNLTALAITDHDTTDGVAEALTYGRDAGLMVIAGLEVSCAHRDFSLHILGYGFDHQHEGLADWLTKLQAGRVERNRNIIKKLQELGVDINLTEVDRAARVGQTGRPHIAARLIAKGVVTTMEQAFSRYLRKGAPAWADRFVYSAIDTIGMIHQAGGLAVLAHPGQLDPAMKKQPRLIAELREAGLDGLEIFYPSHGRQVRKKLLKLADKHSLVVTGGSDFHGNHRPGGFLTGGRKGFCPPDSIVENMYQKLPSQP